MDADDNESDDESTTSSNVDKGKGPLLELPPASKSISKSYAGVPWTSIWEGHTRRLDAINDSLPALMKWLLLWSQPSNTSERQYSLLKLLTMYGLAQSFETLSYRPSSGPSETPDIPDGEYFLQREQNRASFYNVLEFFKAEGILPSTARSLPAGMLLNMLLQDVVMATEEVDDDLLHEFMLLSGYTDDHGNMDMNVFCEWAWDFRIRDTSNAYVEAELSGYFDGGPVGEFLGYLADGHQSGYTLRTIVSAFRALRVPISVFGAILLLQDSRKIYDQILMNINRRYIPYFPVHSGAGKIELDKWQPRHRLVIFVACYMSLRVESPIGRESPATPEREPSPCLKRQRSDY